VGKIPGCKWFECLEDDSSLFTGADTMGVNASLALDKYVIWAELEPPNGTRRAAVKLDKRQNLNNALACASPIGRAEFTHRSSLRKGLATAQWFEVTTKSRVAIGLGDKGVLENGITLHPHFNFPVIPGPAIKGVTRLFVQENEIAAAEEIQWVFGNLPDVRKTDELQAGNVAFFDGWPAQLNAGRTLHQFVERDIMNPHYKEYHREGSGEWPSDNDEPNPIFFPVIKEGSRFELIIAYTQKARLRGASTVHVPLNKVKSWIKDALAQYGIGAKTGSGYGIF
jgi:CRISPR type III-B/RAMP module RAMP protein Cmr6